MPAASNPVKRVWSLKASPTAPAQAKFNIYGNDLPQPEVREKNSASIWDTFDALQGAEAERAITVKTL